MNCSLPAAKVKPMMACDTISKWKACNTSCVSGRGVCQFEAVLHRFSESLSTSVNAGCAKGKGARWVLISLQ